MRIYSNARQLMSEMARDLWEMGTEVKPKTYQNKDISGKDEFVTKEEFCKQYCLTSLNDPEFLFIHTNSRKWADAEFKERISGETINPGNAWKLRPEIWEEFLVSDSRGNLFFDYTYAQRMNSPIMYKGHKETPLDAIVDLLKNDPDTRKAILTIFDSRDEYHYTGDMRIPCSMYYGFFIRNGQLNMTYHQRSSDFITHFGNDVYLAWSLKNYIAEQVNVKPGHLIHTIDSLHCYKKDWSKLKNSVDDYVI